MNDLWTVQQSVYAALTTAPATYPVFDNVPQGATKPYIVISSFDGQPDEELATVTTDANLNIDTWSATSGKMQSHAMLQFVRARLDGQTIAGSWLCTEDFVSILEDPASTAAARIYHGVARYRVRV